MKFTDWILATIAVVILLLIVYVAYYLLCGPLFRYLGSDACGSFFSSLVTIMCTIVLWRKISKISK
jgi:Kef-type K+ transport system membrane component KefB